MLPGYTVRQGDGSIWSLGGIVHYTVAAFHNFIPVRCTVVNFIHFNQRGEARWSRVQTLLLTSTACVIGRGWLLPYCA
jgi:hypothetical protein